MTTYRERHLSGEYFGTIATAVTEPEPEPVEPAPVDDDPDELPVDPVEPPVEPVPESDPDVEEPTEEQISNYIASGRATVTPESEPELDIHPLENLMWKELVAVADLNGIPNYGTRAQLLQRLKDRGVT